MLSLLIGRTVDEFPQGVDGVAAHEGVTPKGPAVHHPDVQRRMEELVFGQILQKSRSNTRYHLVERGIRWGDTDQPC